MNNKIYIGNLNYRTDEDQLSELFSQYGGISDAVIIMDRATNRSKGFGFVTFETTESADAALAYDQQDLDGRKISVKMAKPQTEKSGDRSDRY